LGFGVNLSQVLTSAVLALSLLLLELLADWLSSLLEPGKKSIKHTITPTSNIPPAIIPMSKPFFLGGLGEIAGVGGV
jgi:hypothetical protein